MSIGEHNLAYYLYSPSRQPLLARFSSLPAAAGPTIVCPRRHCVRRGNTANKKWTEEDAVETAMQQILDTKNKNKY